MKLNITVDDSGSFTRSRKISCSQEQIAAFLEFYYSWHGFVIEVPKDMDKLLEIVKNQKLGMELFWYYTDNSDLEVNEELDLDVYDYDVDCELAQEE